MASFESARNTPWASVPTDGWTPELVERWLTYMEDELEQRKLEHSDRTELSEDRQAQRAAVAEMNAATARLKAETDAAKEERLRTKGKAK